MVHLTTKLRSNNTPKTQKRGKKGNCNAAIFEVRDIFRLF